jgi:S1-C subfamily serine protease
MEPQQPQQPPQSAQPGQTENAEPQPSGAFWPPAAPPSAAVPGSSGPARSGTGWVIRRTTAVGAALALAVGSFGAGYAVVQHGGTNQTTASSSTSGRTTTNGWGSLPDGNRWTPPAFGGSDGFGGSTSQPPSNTSQASTSSETGLVEITSRLENGAAAGTGMILTSGGIVVTNHHVVEGATQIRVTVVTTGRTFTARYLGSDSTKDVALLQLVGASGLSTVSVDTSGVSSGDHVTAVGDAGGDGGALTASPGTVTALGQSITAQSEGNGSAQRLTGLIQVNADLMPGDSGGALLNSTGQVVGMNVAASRDSTTGFAIPMSTVMSVVRAIENGDDSGTVHIGYDAFLGVALANSTGTTITGVVDGGAAAAAGLQAGDTITAVSGTRVRTASELRSAIDGYRPGEQVRISWTSGGQTHSATVTLGRAPIA